LLDGAAVNCAGFAGPGAGNNAVLATALKTLTRPRRRFRLRVTARNKKTVSEIWRGWGCGNNPLTAAVAVEL
jgi:hypothetical protein